MSRSYWPSNAVTSSEECARQQKQKVQRSDPAPAPSRADSLAGRVSFVQALYCTLAVLFVQRVSGRLLRCPCCIELCFQPCDFSVQPGNFVGRVFRCFALVARGDIIIAAVAVIHCCVQVWVNAIAIAIAIAIAAAAAYDVSSRVTSTATISVFSFVAIGTPFDDSVTDSCTSSKQSREVVCYVGKLLQRNLPAIIEQICCGIIRKSGAASASCNMHPLLRAVACLGGYKQPGAAGAAGAAGALIGFIGFKHFKHLPISILIHLLEYSLDTHTPAHTRTRTHAHTGRERQERSHVRASRRRMYVKIEWLCMCNMCNGLSNEVCIATEVHAVISIPGGRYLQRWVVCSVGCTGSE